MIKKKRLAAPPDKDRRRKSSLDPDVCSKYVDDKMCEQWNPMVEKHR